MLIDCPEGYSNEYDIFGNKFPPGEYGECQPTPDSAQLIECNDADSQIKMKLKIKETL